MSTNEVPKTEVAGDGINEKVIHTHFPIIAEGMGKTAGIEGAKEKSVYNVRQQSSPNDSPNDNGEETTEWFGN